MELFRDMSGWRSYRADVSGSVGFVPTMGALHAGHGSLLQRSCEENDFTVLSIYLNPTQFNQPADLDGYPQNLERDLTLARELGVDAVLLPRYEDVYPDDFRFQISENQFALELCGADRPGHFTGVLTVVMKLLNIVVPDRAYFGEKDYQQYLLIRDMCAAFFMDVAIIGCDTVRESDGLAMSSRNERLGPEARCQAGKINRLLRSPLCDAEIFAALSELGFAVDYVVSRDGRRFAAATIGEGDAAVRLIDNVRSISENP